jgi:hypothetical protein
VQLLEDFLSQPYYETKMKRLSQLRQLELKELVIDIFIGIAYFPYPELFTSVSSQIASRLRFSDKIAAIQTVAEVLAVLCNTDAFDITKGKARNSTLKLQSQIELPDQLVEFIEHSEFLPPMVCEPLPLTHNFSSGYLTHNDSLILGQGNHHDGDICLDVLNTMNRVALKLDVQFLCHLEEEPTFELDTQEKTDQWNRFKKQSYYFYSLMEQQGNRFYFNHKVDKRGRIYTHGYHINTQGTSFKKAMLEFADEELVEGMP